MCASACFFIFVAGIKREMENPLSANVPILGIHRPYLSDDDLNAMTGEQAISSANQIRPLVESYLKEMNVPTKYAELMHSISKDQMRWIKPAEFRADFEGPIPELNDWISARCDTRTEAEKNLWRQMMADTRLLGQQSALEQSSFALMSKKMRPIEPPRVCRRPFGLSYAAMAGCSSMA